MRAIAATVLLAGSLLCPQLTFAEDPLLDIGSRWQLMVDRHLIDELSGEAAFYVHEPEPQEVVLVTGEPWEGNTSAYYTIFQDGDIYRMYYRGSHFDEETQRGAHREVTCYAESRDGVHWIKPELGLFDWDGSKANNIILDGLGTHCFVAFKDESPDCPPEAKYKGISRGQPKGLYVFQSPDGIRWSLISDQPVITQGAFDSQNLAFWDSHTGQYVCYYRNFVDGVRSIMMCTSDDFLNWSDPVQLRYPDAPHQHLYTNAIRPAPRAEQIRIGFPTRYLPEGSRVEPIFMASRDGVTFTRYDKPVIPQSAPQDRDGNRSNYMANGLVQLPLDDNTFSVYGTEAYYTGPDSRLRRFTYRVDGYVSLRSGAAGGQLLSKPLRFEGSRLILNATTAPQGSIRIELQDAGGEALPGFAADECQPIEGDRLDHPVRWGDAGQLDKLQGQTIRIRMVMRDADVYAVGFQ